MKKLKYKFASAFLALFLMFNITGCEEDDGSGYTFKMNISSNPENLDPQMATDVNSRLIISNMMDGLVRITENGSIEADVAENYLVSDDGMTYTFNLKENVTWENVDGYKAEVTADDFVFAFQRIFDSEALYSPYIDVFKCIKNSSKIASGELSPDKLGVIAEENYVLKIELEYPYYNFLELLSTTAAMPCNRAFFESTKGKYGLTAETTASNGDFYLKEWNFDPYWDNNYIIMRRNKSNSEQDFVYPYSLNFFIKDKEENIEDFDSGDIDCIISDTLNEKLFKGNKYNSYSTKAYGLVINPQSQFFKNKNLRYALAAAFNREVYSALLSEDYSAAYGIIPPYSTILGKKYRLLSPDNAFSLYDKYESQNLWQGELEKLKIASIDGIKITVPESFGGHEYLNYITEQWQQNLNFFCGIEVVSQNEYDLKIKENTYNIALVELSSENAGIDGYFNLFTEGKEELQGYTDYAVKSMIYGSSKSENLSKATEIYKTAEKQIIDSAVYVPLFYGNEYFVYNQEIQDIEYDASSQIIDFRYAKKFE